MSQPPELIRFPFELPQQFAEQLGYRGERRFVTAYWEPLGDEVTIGDDRTSATGLGDPYVWSDLLHRRWIRNWLMEHNVNLGNSDESATHWLIIDRAANRGYIAPVDFACRMVRQQRLTTIE